MENENLDKPTELTRKDIDKFVESLSKEEIIFHKCFTCGQEHLPNYGYHLDECDECYFSRFKKEDREKFFRSFFE